MKFDDNPKHDLPVFSDLLSIERKCNSDCEWSLARLDSSDSVAFDKAIDLMALIVMRHRMIGVEHLFELWRELVEGVREPEPEHDRRLVPYLEGVLGTPDAPKSPTHVEGMVAEYLWWVLSVEGQLGQLPIRYLTEPDPQTTKPGGDGLGIYERDDSDLLFRLWEIKKHNQAGATGIGATVTTACDQLMDDGPRYLAQYTRLAAQHPDAEVRNVLANLTDAWDQGTDLASAGVAVTSSYEVTNAFGKSRGKFHHIDHDLAFEGAVTVVVDLGRFATSVREKVWSALSTHN